MSLRIRRNLTALQDLVKASNAVKRSMISNADKDLILSLVECATNIIRGNVKLSDVQFRRLKRYKTELERFTKPKTSQKEKKELLQRGGFLGALLKPLIGLLLGS